MEEKLTCRICQSKFKLGESNLQGGEGIYCETCLKETCEKCSHRCQDCQTDNCLLCLLKCTKCSQYFCQECQEKDLWGGICDTCLEGP